MKAVEEAHGGTMEKFIGDAVMAVLGCRSRTKTTRCARAAPRSVASNRRLDREFQASFESLPFITPGE
jgi:class 3 adenylate cyclase